MKNIIILIGFLTFVLFPAQAVKKFEADPINIAAVIVEKSDSSMIASTLDFYGYTFQTEEDDYIVMKHPNGDEIRYSFSTLESKYPIVEVKAKGTRKSIDKRLNELDFDKSGNGYEKIRNLYSKFKTQCNFGPRGTLIFRRSPNKKD